MAYLIGVFEGDFDAFKQQFDSDPLGRKAVAKGHSMMRGVDNPNEIYLRVEFDTVDQAREFREKVRSSDVLANMDVKLGPNVTELVDRVDY